MGREVEEKGPTSMKMIVYVKSEPGITGRFSKD